MGRSNIEAVIEENSLGKFLWELNGSTKKEFSDLSKLSKKALKIQPRNDNRALAPRQYTEGVKNVTHACPFLYRINEYLGGNYYQKLTKAT